MLKDWKCLLIAAAPLLCAAATSAAETKRPPEPSRDVPGVQEREPSVRQVYLRRQCMRRLFPRRSPWAVRGRDMSWFRKIERGLSRHGKRDMPDGLWRKCDGCGADHD